VEVGGIRAQSGRDGGRAIPVPGLILHEDLRDRRAVVTGGARGIGAAIARWLIAAGAKVTVVDRDRATLERVFDEEPCHLVTADLASDGAALAKDLTEDGPVELIVNNVGINSGRSFLDLREADFDAVMNTNLRGPLFFTQGLVKALVERRASEPGQRSRRGSILFISSLHERYFGDDVHYSLSKRGVTTAAQVLAKQLAPFQIRVNSISPGWIRTAEDPNTPEQVAKRDFLGPRVALGGQPGVPDDVARVAIFLLSDAWSGYVTAQNIDVDGGLSLFNFRDKDGPPATG
jgi:glucose 1-dehydrogenase